MHRNTHFILLILSHVILIHCTCYHFMLLYCTCYKAFYNSKFVNKLFAYHFWYKSFYNNNDECFDILHMFHRLHKNDHFALVTLYKWSTMYIICYFMWNLTGQSFKILAITTTNMKCTQSFLVDLKLKITVVSRISQETKDNFDT